MKVKLTIKDALEIYNNCRKCVNAKPATVEFCPAVLKILFNDQNILDDDRLKKYKTKIKNVRRRLDKYLTRQRKRISSENFSLDEVCISSDDFMTSDSVNLSELQDCKKRKKLPLEDVSSSRQQYRRLEPVIEKIKEIADEEDTTPAYLIGRVLHQLYYKSDKQIAYISNILMGKTTSHKISVEAASHVKNYNNLGREGYQRNIRALQVSGFDAIPSWKATRSFESSVTPECKPIEGGLGVEFSYKAALTMTIERILDSMETLPTDENLTLNVKDGLDGSGSHSIFNQSGKFQVILTKIC